MFVVSVFNVASYQESSEDDLYIFRTLTTDSMKSMSYVLAVKLKS